MTDDKSSGRDPRCATLAQRLRNRLAVWLFELVATTTLREQAERDWYDGLHWRAHQQRRRLGFVRCEEESEKTLQQSVDNYSEPL